MGWEIRGLLICLGERGRLAPARRGVWTGLGRLVVLWRSRGGVVTAVYGLR